MDFDAALQGKSYQSGNNNKFNHYVLAFIYDLYNFKANVGFQQIALILCNMNLCVYFSVLFSDSSIMAAGLLSTVLAVLPFLLMFSFLPQMKYGLLIIVHPHV